MGYQYPVEPARLNGDATAVEIHQFLKSPRLITRAIQELTAQRFIADYLLPGRYTAEGGSILFEKGGESIFAADKSEAVAPGGEFPLTSFTGGELAIAATRKWGLDSEVTDESISRSTLDPVGRALRKLANTLVRDIDSVALGVIASSVQATQAASAPWTSADAIIESVLMAKARREEELTGYAYDFDTVVLRPAQHALVLTRLLNSGALRDIGSQAITSGVLPNVLGLNWVTSTHVPFEDPFVVDRAQLGGMADENIQSPGYSRAADGVGVETKSIREDKTEGYLLRARRVTVPVVLEPNAGFSITGTGL